MATESSCEASGCGAGSAMAMAGLVEGAGEEVAPGDVADEAGAPMRGEAGGVEMRCCGTAGSA